MFCPGHAGVSGNERADRLASAADITSGLHLGRAEVLRGLRNFLNMNRPEHHSIDCLKERGVEKGSGRHSILQGRERSKLSQRNIGTVSMATLGRLLRDGAEQMTSKISCQFVEQCIECNICSTIRFELQNILFPLFLFQYISDILKTIIALKDAIRNF